MLIHEIPVPVPESLGVSFNVGAHSAPFTLALPPETSPLAATAFDTCRLFAWLPVRRRTPPALIVDRVW